MKILYFGIYSKGVEYPRNRNLIKGLCQNGHTVLEAHFTLVESFHERMKVAKSALNMLRFLLRILSSYAHLSLHFYKAPQVDAIIVGHPGYFHIHLARVLRYLFKPHAVLIYDIFIPLYNALVEDRGQVEPNGFLAGFLKWFETSACHQADVNIIDTYRHCDYIRKTFNVPGERIKRVLVGSTIANFYGDISVRNDTPFKVLYVGTYIPLHGVDNILQAAQALIGVKDICFILAGTGQLREAMEARAYRWALSNVAFQDWVETEKLGDLIRSCHLSLGVFGATAKTERVIPSKIYDICQAGVPFITSDTPAIREIFVHCENAFLIPQNNPKALADAILQLKENGALRKKIAYGAMRTADLSFAPKRIARDLTDAITERRR